MQRKSSELVIKNLEFIKAHAEGKTIEQRQTGTGNLWSNPVHGPEFLNGGYEFRIKPEVITLRKWKGSAGQVSNLFHWVQVLKENEIDCWGYDYITVTVN